MMFCRKFSTFDSGKISISQIVSDPHGELVSFYDGENNCLHITEIKSIVRYFQTYRKQFIITKQYDHVMPIQTLMTIKLLQRSEGISGMVVSQQMQNTQYVIFVYITMIEVVAIKPRRKLIMGRKLYKFPFQIIHMNALGKLMYVSMFNLTMAAIDISKKQIYASKSHNNIETIFINETHFITKPNQNPQNFENFELTRLVQSSSQNQKKLWQSVSGNLMHGQQIIGSNFSEHLQLSDADKEQQLRQQSSFFPIKYHVSPCRQFVIGADEVKNIYYPNESKYSIRSKYGSWGQIFQAKYHPQINPFWTFYRMYQRQNKKDITGRRINQKLNREEKILIAYFDTQKQQIIVSWIRVNYSQRKKVIIPLYSKMSNKPKHQQTKLKYQSNEQVISHVMNLKHPFLMLKWISLYQLIFLDVNNNAYFVEFDFQFMKCK